MPQDFGRRLANPRLSSLQGRERIIRQAPQLNTASRIATEPTTLLQGFEAIARETGVPVNVLLTDDRLSGAETAEAALELGRQAAGELQDHFVDGRGLTDALRSALGDERLVEGRVDQSLRIGRQLYPEAFPDNSVFEDTARSLGAGGATGAEAVFSELSNLGRDTREAYSEADIREPLLLMASRYLMEHGGARGARFFGDLGRRLQAGMDTEALEAMQNAMPQGDLLRPSTWDFGENPSPEGYLYLGANVLGSLLPVIAGTVATRSPLGGAAVGGLQGAGAAGEEAEDLIMRAYENGTLEDTSAYYRELLREGVAPDEAAQRTAEAAARFSRMLTMPVAAFGGYATGAIFRGAAAPALGSNVAARVGGSAAIGAVEEGSQEALEGVATRAGVNIGAGMDESLTEDSFANFVLGALAGGPVGAAGGVGRGPVPQGPDDDLLDQPLNEPPAPPATTLPPESDLNGSAPGPLSAALEASPERLPGAQVGDRVYINDHTSGNLHTGELIGEDAAGIHVSINGQTFTFDDQMLSSGIEILQRHDGATEQAAQTSTPAAEPPTNEPTRSDNRSNGELSGSLISEIELLQGFTMTSAQTQALAQAMRETRQLPSTERAAAVRQRLEQIWPEGTAPWRMDPAEVDEIVGTIEDGDEARTDGQPFPTVEVATLAMQRRGLDLADFEPVRVDDGFVMRPIAEPLPSPNDPGAYPKAPTPDDDAPEPGWPSEVAPAPDADVPPTPEQGVSEPEPAQGIEAEADVALGETFGDLLDGVQPLSTEIEEAAAAAEPEPTDAQKEAGNYKKGHAKVFGLDVTIENARGSERRGRSPDGTEWAVTMPAHYGYVKRTEGADGDHVDVYVAEGATTEQQDDAPVWVINQVDPDTRAFDEHKVVLGAQDETAALALYEAGFSDGRGSERIGSFSQTTAGDFRDWLQNGDTKQPTAPIAEEDTALADPPTLTEETATQPAADAQAEISAEQRKVLEGLFNATGSSLGNASVSDAVNAAVHVLQEKPRTGGMLSGKFDTFSFDQWHGQNRVPKPQGKLFLRPDRGLDAYYLNVAKADAVLGEPSETGGAATPTAEPDEKLSKIEDFGEHIPGARKDRASAFATSFDEPVDRYGDASMARYFPVPDYEAMEANGVSRRVLGALAEIRANIRSNPGRSSYSFSDYIYDLEDARQAAVALLAGDLSPEDAVRNASFANREPSVWLDFAESLENANDLRRAAVYRINVNYKGQGDERRISDYYAVKRARSSRSIVVMSETRDGIYEKLKGQIEFDKAKAADGGGNIRKPPELQVAGFARSKDYAIWYRLPGKGWTVWERFPTSKAAREHFDANKEAILQQIDTLRDGLNERLTENPNRIGQSHRKGNVTPEDFAVTFGFRGVQFGNWNNNKDRQSRLNDTWDALHDLAGVLDVPLKALSLDGKLGLAFGARGRGGRNPAAAHFEPGQRVINLTRKSGAGSLAHEWFHALDHELGQLHGLSQSALFMDRPRRNNTASKLSENEVSALFGLYHALRKRGSPWFARSEKADKFRSKPYFATTVELAARGFEKLVTDRLAMRAMQNGFLANIDQGSGAYPTTRELRRQDATKAYNEVLDLVRDRMAEKGDARVTLPDPDPSLLDDTVPQVGFTWRGPGGIVAEIVASDGDTLTVKSTPASGEANARTLEMSLNEVEDLIESHAEYNDPEAAAKAEAERTALAEKEKARVDAREEKRLKYGPLKRQADELIEQFIRDTGRKPEAVRGHLGATFYLGDVGHASRATHALEQVRDRDGYVNDFGRLRYHGGYFYEVMNLKIVGDFVSWLNDKGITPAPPDLSEAEIEAEADQALAEVFGGTAGGHRTGSSASSKGAPTSAPDRSDRGASEAAKSAASNLGMSLDQAMQGARELFGGSDTLSSGFTWSQQTYEKAKPYFIAAAAHLTEAGADLRDLAQALRTGFVEKLGLTAEQTQGMMPYFKRFLVEVAERKIDPWASAKDASDASDDTDQGSRSGSDPDSVAGRVSRNVDGSVGGGPADSSGSASADGRDRDRGSDAGDAGADARGSLWDGDTSSGPTRTLTGDNPGNFEISDGFALGEGTPKTRLENNLTALRLVKELDLAGRHATKAEQEVLARYVGWGGLSRAFDAKEADSTNVWGKAQRELKALLTTGEYDEAVKSTRNAHYTSRTVVSAMWDAMRRMGVQGGRGLEPTIGTGNFLGLEPRTAEAEWFGAELDPLTGKIAQYLYPEAKIFAGRGFQDAPFNFGAFDFAVGNPPFGDDTVVDNNPGSEDLHKLKIHNYVMVKTARHLRPGGIMGMVITSRFLDGASNAEGRNLLAKDMRFLGAARLPNTAFLENAGTEVVTDVVFFQKLRPGETAEADPAWLSAVEIQTDDGPATINRYFAENPSLVLGKNSLQGTQYKVNEYAVLDDGRDLKKALADFVETLPAGAYGDPVRHQIDALSADDRTDLPLNGMALLDDGRIILNRHISGLRGQVVEVSENTEWSQDARKWGVALGAAKAFVDADAETLAAAAEDMIAAGHLFMSQNPKTKAFTKRKTNVKAEASIYRLYDLAEAKVTLDTFPDAATKKALADDLAEIQKRYDSRLLGKKNLARLRGMLGLRNQIRNLLALERTTNATATSEMERARAAASKGYDAFVRSHGFLGDTENVKVLNGDLGIEQAAESGYQKKQGSKAAGTLVAAAADRGQVLDQRVLFPIEAPTSADSPADALLIAMQERGRPDLAYMAKLTGQSISDVRDALLQAEPPLLFQDPITADYVFTEEYLSGNVKQKLAEARAAGVDNNVQALLEVQPEDIPPERIVPSMGASWMPTEVIEEFLQDLGADSPVVFRDLAAGVTEIKTSSYKPSALGSPFVHPRADIERLAKAAITGKAITIMDTIERGKTVKNEEASRSASALADQMAVLFQDWAFQSPRRRDDLSALFNEKMNTRIERVWNGDLYLRPKGANEVLIENMRRTQKNGAWRMIQSRSSLMHHVVGAGKTWTAVMAVMERKRLGLSQRPMVSVPNHLTEQWANEWREVYPGAKLLVVGGKNFDAKARRRMLAQMATADVDAIIISHQALGYIQNDPAIEAAQIDEMIAALRGALDTARKDNQSQRTVKQIGKRIEKYQEKMKALKERKVDVMDGATFEDLGVDYLVVDEAHQFKNLEYFTLGDRLVGMNDPNGSKRAFDLFLKTRSIMSRQPNGGISFLTGTPISNSLVEIYTTLKYLHYDALKAEGLLEFDAFAGNFIRAETRFEITASQTVKERRILAGLINLQALSQQYREISDVILRSDLERIYVEAVREWNEAHPDEPPRPERFPTPKVKTGSRSLLTAPATETQRLVTDWLVARTSAIKANRSNKEYSKIDNDLWVLTDARKSGLDPRTIDPTQARDEDSKVNRSAREIKRIYDAWDEDRGVQLVFSDLSTPVSTASSAGKRALADHAKRLLGSKPATEWLNTQSAAERSYLNQWEMLTERAVAMLDDETLLDVDRQKVEDWLENVDPEMEALMQTLDTGFSMYDDLKKVLIEDYGIPEREIAFIHDARSDDEKVALFGRVRRGEVRVLVGSTPKMGAGTNVQTRLVALHHLDAPWRPSDVEQREGRIIRQGNELYARDPDAFEIEILAYSTEGTSDVVMWQVLERKAAAIEQFLAGAVDGLEEGEGDAASFAEFMAQATGDNVFRDKLAQDAIVTRIRSDVEGRQIAKVTADRELDRTQSDLMTRRARIKAAEAVIKGAADLQAFIAGWNDESARRKSAIDVAKKAKKPAPRFDPLSPIQELAGVMADVETTHRAAHDRWLEKVENTSQQRNDMKAKGVPEAKWPALPTAPSRAGLTSQPVRDRSRLAQKVFETLGRIDKNAEFQSLELSYGDLGTLIFNAEARYNLLGNEPNGSTRVRVFLRPKNSEENLPIASQVTGRPEMAPDIVRAISPQSILKSLVDTVDRDREAIARLEDRIPQLQTIQNLDIDTSSLDAAELAATFFKIRQNMAERQADLDRAERGDNPFIERDVMRNLGRAVTARPFLTKSGTIEFDGDSYTDLSSGIMNRHGMGGGFAFNFMAKRASDETSGILTLHADAEGKLDEAEPVRFIAEPPSPNLDADNQRRRNTPASRAKRSKAVLQTALNEQLAAVGLEGSAVIEVTSRLLGKTTDGKPVELDARQRGRLIQVAMDADDPAGAMNHEIVHLLRSEELWGSPYGLFTKKEWQTLVREARKQKRMMARAKTRYPDLSAAAQIEEVVAEMYRAWRQLRSPALRPVAGLLRRIGDVLRGIGRAVLGLDYATAHEVMTAIEGGVIGERAQQRNAKGQFAKDPNLVPERHMRRDPDADRIGRRVIDEVSYFGADLAKMAGGAGRRIANLRKSEGRSNTLTDAMVGAQDGRFSVLALVPGNQLLSDLARFLPSARRYQRTKDEMDATRNEWQARMAETSDEWGRLLSRDQAANAEMMAIMHEATLEGVDPSGRGIQSKLTKAERALLDVKGITGVDEDLRGRAEEDQKAMAAYTTLRQRFAGLPRAFRDIYRLVQSEYDAQQNEFEKALIENLRKSQNAAKKTAQRNYDKAVQRIRDDGLQGQERKDAMQAARKQRDHEIGAMEASLKSRITMLRVQFETARLKGPYFPLTRFGQYFVALRDDEGAIISFSRFESVADQQAFLNTDAAKSAATAEHGVLDNDEALREKIAPTFMADIQKLLGEANVDNQLMDEVWQRYLRTLPDASVRSRQIHRKGTPGFSRDAYRAFANHMFHGAHQLARLKYGIDLTDALQDMRQEAAVAKDKNRARAVVNELQHRHNFTMNPTGAPWAQSITQLAFVWYLGVTPAAAMVNLTQTSVVGPGVLAAMYKGGLGKVASEMARAGKDFGSGRLDIRRSKRLTLQEKDAVEEAYRRGVIDRTQAHDLAQIGETGIQYNSAQQTVMRAVSAFFHRAEVANREITFMAAYRLGRADGLDHSDAIERADQATYRIHFDYQNTSRPRAMQGDVAKVVLIFRNFTVNMLYRLVRDVHQSFNGASPEAKKEARVQLAAITASMALHAGIRGVWGYGIVTTLLGAFFPGGDDDVERHLQRLLVGEEDGTILADVRRNVGGVILNGLPGHVFGVSLSERIGMPNLWFRDNSRDLEGRDAYWHYVHELLGPAFALGEGVTSGIHGALFEPGNLGRDIERAVPKFVRDLMRAGRYASEGVETWNGDSIIENTSIADTIRQAIGFTPAVVAERYAANSRMLNRQNRIESERRALLREITDLIRAGRELPASVSEDVIQFNRRYPEYAISNETVRRSLSGRLARAARNEFGVALRPSLNRQIRSEEAPLIYGAD